MTSSEQQPRALEEAGDRARDAKQHPPTNSTEALEAKARRQQRFETGLREAIHAALCDYRMTNMGDADDPGLPYPLIDLCSNDGATIDTGREELLNLADFLVSDGGVISHLRELQEENARLREGLKKIAAGTEDSLPPFRGISSSHMASIARQALTTPRTQS